MKKLLKFLKMSISPLLYPKFPIFCEKAREISENEYLSLTIPEIPYIL
jgi:hypothetical protein